MARSKGEEMLGKAMKSKAKRVAKRGNIVSDLYTGATKGLAKVGNSIKSTIASSTATDRAMINGMRDSNGKIPFKPMSLDNPNAKRKRSKPRK